MPRLKNLAILAAFLALSYLFFNLATDNGFWHNDDFHSLEQSLRIKEDISTIFVSDPPFKFQPIVYLIYYFLFSRFLFNALGYFIFNIMLHGFNSFLVYILVYTLLDDRTIALLSGVLFVFTVGSFGKSVMIMSGLEDLFITTMTLLTMIFYFKHELSQESKLFGRWYMLALLFFLASMLTRTTSFSILGAFLAFNFFFREGTGRRILNANFVILILLAVAALIVKAVVFRYTPPLYTHHPGTARFAVLAVKNVFSYLVRMIFPIHTSHLVTESGAAVRFIYRFATEIRLMIALTVISYSLFGFIFGNRAIRFFIAWTYIMVIPFAFFQFPSDWLNIRHLYLVSVGFVMVISSGAVFCSRLISGKMWQRMVPMLVPIFFVLVSRFIVVQLDRSYESKAASPNSTEMKKAFSQRYPDRVRYEGGELLYIE